MYCQSDKGYTTFYLQNGKNYIASRPIKDFEAFLPNNIFIRTHQSYVVNLKYIELYDKSGYAFLQSGKKIPVATRKKEDFLSRLL